MKKIALYAVISICFASTYPMTPLFRAGQRTLQAPYLYQTAPLLCPNKQQRNFSLLTILELALAASSVSLASSATGAFGIKHLYHNYIRPLVLAYKTVNVQENPNQYSSDDLQKYIHELQQNKYALLPRRGQEEMLQTLTRAQLENKFRPFAGRSHLLIPPYPQELFEKYTQDNGAISIEALIAATKEANRYNRVGEDIHIPKAIRNLLYMAREYPEIRRKFDQGILNERAKYENKFTSFVLDIGGHAPDAQPDYSSKTNIISDLEILATMERMLNRGY